MCPIDGNKAPAELAGGAWRSLHSAETKSHCVNVYFRLEGVTVPRRERPQPFVVNGGVAQLEETAPIVLASIRLRGGSQTLGALEVDKL
jgi:hypothetical protein